MTKLTKIVANCETGITEEIELTESEVLEIQQRESQMQILRAEREAEEEARLQSKLSAEAKLSALGLTPEEIAALSK